MKTHQKKTVTTWINEHPLMHYGSPHYAMLGTPVWYPFTLLLAILGYTPSVLAFSYALHVAFGGFGMFLLAKAEVCQNLRKVTTVELGTSVAAGMLYCGSGVFLSNAQHIMIIISVAWIPYVFYYFRQYLSQNRVLYAMLAGVFAGLIWLGGYPEIFYNMFLFLIPYTVYFFIRRIFHL